MPAILSSATRPRAGRIRGLHLFDCSFDTFITPRIVTIVCMAATVLVAVATLELYYAVLRLSEDVHHGPGPV